MLYLHIGLQKTGTTALQLALSQSEMLIYAFDRPRKIVHKREVDLYSSGNQKFYLKCKKNIITANDIELLRTGGFISCENFTNLVSGISALKNIINILKKNKIDYEILITYRVLDEYIPSLYAELTTNSLMCEMRSYSDFCKKIKKEFTKLQALLEQEPKIEFQYSPEVNDKILEHIGAGQYRLFNSRKNSKTNQSQNIKYYEAIAVKNRTNGCWKHYRKKLRNKHKGDEFNASHFYVFMTYFRSLMRFALRKF